MITVYSGPNCASCAMVKKFLNMKEVRFQEKSVNDPGVVDEIIRLTGFMSVPVITNGKSVSQGWNPAQLTEIINQEKET